MHAQPMFLHDLPCIRLQAEGAQAQVSLHGAQVLSWLPAGGGERLFLSRRAQLDGTAAIRGGIPVIFPQFGARGPLGKHGFARNALWRFDAVSDGEAGFVLAGDGNEHRDWPHAFIARLGIRLDATRLHVSLRIENTGAAPFDFTAALHTYLRVDNATRIGIDGLQGREYEDSAQGGSTHRQGEIRLGFDGETDRIYRDAAAALTLVDVARHLRIAQSGFEDAVVWNPGEILASTIADLAPGEWREFVCVEAAQVLQPVTLVPGEQWRGVQVLG